MKNILTYNINKMHPDQDVPPQDRNPYTIWYKYAHQNLNLYNKIARKYNMARLQRPLNIKSYDNGDHAHHNYHDNHSHDHHDLH